MAFLRTIGEGSRCVDVLTLPPYTNPPDPSPRDRRTGKRRHGRKKKLPDRRDVRNKPDKSVINDGYVVPAGLNFLVAQLFHPYKLFAAILLPTSMRLICILHIFLTPNFQYCHYKTIQNCRYTQKESKICLTFLDTSQFFIWYFIENTFRVSWPYVLKLASHFFAKRASHLS